MSNPKLVQVRCYSLILNGKVAYFCYARNVAAAMLRFIDAGFSAVTINTAKITQSQIVYEIPEDELCVR